jgi:hypothetical protein
MKVYVFGNPDIEVDSLAIRVAREIEEILRLPDPAQRIKRAQDDKLVFESLTSLSSEVGGDKEEVTRLSGLSHRPRSVRDDISAIESLADMSFVCVKPNEDLPFVDDSSMGSGQDMVVILDVVEGIDEVTVFTEKDLEKLELAPRTSAHEYDLGFQLRYLRKLGKIGKVRIVGLPMKKKK